MSILLEAAWCRALTLAERLGAGPALSNKPQDFISEGDGIARERLAYWRSQKPFDMDGFFGRRLAADGISEQDLLFLLAEPEDHLHARHPQRPTWVERLEAWASCPVTDFKLPESLTKSYTAPFLIVFAPWITGGREQLRREIEEVTSRHPKIPFDPALLEQSLYQELPSRVLSAISRTMVLELNVARVQNLLKGSTPAERFSSFIERVQRPEEILVLLQEYPVLARRIIEIISNWLSSSVEFISHLCSDWNSLRNIFFPETDPGIVTATTGGLGDLHRGGRAVRKVSFNSGAVLIYKPRPLSIDVHFQELLQWFNNKQSGLHFRAIKVMEARDHGWMEFVEAQACTSEDQVARFYERQGALLALLYALNAADFHHENLIAAGEHPVLVDLESLFHPPLDDVNAGEAELVGNHAMDESVMRTGFLPLRFWTVEGSKGIDLSGLGGAPGQLLPQPVPGWEQPGTDEMHFVRQQRTLEASQNRPTLLGNPLSVTEYKESVESGFKRLYYLLRHNQRELLADDGPLARFANDELRVILRPTLTYSNLLNESSHPDVARDALDRDCLFDRLWMEVDQFPCLARTIPSEIADLHQGDVPKFTTRPTSYHLWSGSGECLQDFFRTSAMGAARKRIQRFSEEDLARQLWFISASLATLEMERPEKAVYEIRQPASLVSLPELREPLICKAQEAGERLHSLVLQGQQQITWIGLAFSSAGWTLEPASLDLYNGLPGIALFLAYLGEISQKARYTELAQKALATALSQLRKDSSSMKSIGFFGGLGGVIYLLSHLGRLWKSSDLFDEANHLLNLLPPLIESDKDFDIIYGSAGCIGSLLSLHYSSPSERARAAIQQCGQHLVSHAKPMPTGVAWECNFPAEQPLTGFSHGAAGICWALMEAASLTGDVNFFSTALAGVAYEQSVFRKEYNNWPDFRVGMDGNAPSTNGMPIPCAPTWCNGAPGIGLSRLAMLPHTDKLQLRQDLDTALNITLETGIGLNHSLCHGDMGNLELLIQANSVLKTDDLQDRLTWAANVTYNSIQQHGWLTGVPKGIETPGLMLGLAGIGYGLLRLAEPDRVPPVVSLGLPRD